MGFGVPLGFSLILKVIVFGMGTSFNGVRPSRFTTRMRSRSATMMRAVCMPFIGLWGLPRYFFQTCGKKNLGEVHMNNNSHGQLMAQALKAHEEAEALRAGMSQQHKNIMNKLKAAAQAKDADRRMKEAERAKKAADKEQEREQSRKRKLEAVELNRQRKAQNKEIRNRAAAHAKRIVLAQKVLNANHERAVKAHAKAISNLAMHKLRESNLAAKVANALREKNRTHELKQRGPSYNF